MTSLRSPYTFSPFGNRAIGTLTPVSRDSCWCTCQFIPTLFERVDSPEYRRFQLSVRVKRFVEKRHRQLPGFLGRLRIKLRGVLIFEK